MKNTTGTKPKKLLIITSSGGGGLIQTANAKEQEARAKDPNIVIIRRDLLKDWVWAPVGSFFINFWNQSQMRGNVFAQKFVIAGQFIADYLLHPTVFFYALYTTFKEDVDHIIDTQPLGTSAIVKALKIFNRKKGKNVKLEKILVDLPTRKATHFYRAIKNLSKESKKVVQLTSIPPLLEEGETAEQFWQETCGLSASDINMEEVYVRAAFKKFKGKERSKDTTHITIRYKNEEELRLMKKAFLRGPIHAKVGDHQVDFEIGPEDKCFTVLLGSQPAKGATFNYVKKLTSVAKEFPQTTIHIFAFCADHLPGDVTLFRKVSEFVAQLEDYPKNLSVIPFSFQTENAIAPLFHRSDATCTRSGGQTAMELMCVSNGEIWIHSEARKGQELLDGIPGWEAASAAYLQKLHGAKIITPDTIMSVAKKLIQTGNAPADPNLLSGCNV